MDIMIGFIISFIILLFGILKGVYIGLPLSLCLIVFLIIAYKRTNSIKNSILMAWNGGKKALIVVKIFILIGIVTAVWLSAGTVPAIVFYGIKFLNPRFFILYTFLISGIVSYMLGTSFGTVGTVGVALMVIAKGGNINPNLAAGAIISGCYFGDRTSPMSSAVNLLANITDTELYPLLKKLFKNTIIPLLIVCGFYFIFSINNPLNVKDSGMEMEISKIYKINIMVLLPAIFMLILSSLKVDVKLSMVISIITGVIIAIVVQNISFDQLIKTIITGYNLDETTFLADIMKGGGIFSMMKAGLVVFISCGMAGILEGINISNNISNLFINIDSRWKLLITTALVSLFTAAFGGNQSIAIVLASQIMKTIYDRLEVDRYELGQDIGNTAIILSPIIPWNISNIIPSSTLHVSGLKFIPYAFYLYMPLLTNLILLRTDIKSKMNS